MHLQNNSFEKCANSREVRRKWESESIQERKNLSNKSSNIRKIEIDDTKAETSTTEDWTKDLGRMITFQQEETTEIRNRIRASWATFHKSY